MSQLIEVEAILLDETPEAYLLASDEDEPGNWVPMARVRALTDMGSYVVVKMQERVAVNANLV